MADKKYIIQWEGPYSSQEWEECLKQPDYYNHDAAYSLYALTNSHPLYGDDCIVYIGKTHRDIRDRLREHTQWWEGKAYLGLVFPFITWERYNQSSIEDALYIAKEKVEQHDLNIVTEIEKIESLLIFALQPSYNIKNKKSANDSNSIRLFNVGSKGSIPDELSSLYVFENSPEPERIDEEQLSKFGKD